MRLYYTGASPDNLRKAREHAPSHSHGYGWTPQKMTPHDAPYFLDNGAYNGNFNKSDWLDFLDRALSNMPSLPDFILYPDVVCDAEATIERCRDIFRYWHPNDLGLIGEFDRYFAVQPGVPLERQLAFAEDIGAVGIFVGGDRAWKRAWGSRIVIQSNERGLRTHVGSPGGLDGLVWAYRMGFDSCDTTTIFQNCYWHYLENLEAATEETGSSGPDSVQQTWEEVGPA